MNNHNYEMATPINSLQTQYNPNVNNLVRNVENNIENLNNTNSTKELMNGNINYQPFNHNEEKLHQKSPDQIPQQQQSQQQQHQKQMHQQQMHQQQIPEQQFHKQQYQSYQSQPQHSEYNPNITNNIVRKEDSLQKEPSRVVSKIPWHKRLLVNSKEYLIMILLFSLLAHKKINKLLMVTIPFIDTYESPMPSLILRGIILAILMFIIKYFV